MGILVLYILNLSIETVQFLKDNHDQLIMLPNIRKYNWHHSRKLIETYPIKYKSKKSIKILLGN
jgi:hypothetical protein